MAIRACDFCGKSMGEVGDLYASTRAAVCLSCAQAAVAALSPTELVSPEVLRALPQAAPAVLSIRKPAPVVVQAQTVLPPAAEAAGHIFRVRPAHVATAAGLLLLLLLRSRRRS